MDRGRHPAQRQRPIHRRIAPPGNHHPLAAQILAPTHIILYRPGRLIRRQPVQRRPVRPERPSPRRHYHRLRRHRVALVRGQGKRPGLPAQRFHPAAQQARRRKRRNLRLQPRHQIPRLNRRMRGNVVNRLLRIQRRTLPADLAQRVDQHGLHFQHAQFKHGEQPSRAGTHNGDIGMKVLAHAIAYSGRRRLARGNPTPTVIANTVKQSRAASHNNTIS